jgi:NTP pyrophosphatase (non-canonical NTP hydrolase)
MSKNDTDTTIQELKDLMIQFRAERDWSKHHTPKNLAVSIAIEAAELMELYQWDELPIQNQQEVNNELANILMYCFSFANTCNIDIATTFRDKLAAVKKEYPVELFNKDRVGIADYERIKKAYRVKRQP